MLENLERPVSKYTLHYIRQILQCERPGVLSFAWEKNEHFGHNVGVDLIEYCNDISE